MQARVSVKSTDAFAAARHRELTARLQHFAEITTSLAERDQLGLVFRHDPNWSPGAHRNRRSFERHFRLRCEVRELRPERSRLAAPHDHRGRAWPGRAFVRSCHRQVMRPPVFGARPRGVGTYDPARTVIVHFALDDPFTASDAARPAWTGDLIDTFRAALCATVAPAIRASTPMVETTFTRFTGLDTPAHLCHVKPADVPESGFSQVFLSVAGVS